MSLRVLALAVLVATAAACQDNPCEPSVPKVIITQTANDLQDGWCVAHKEGQRLGYVALAGVLSIAWITGIAFAGRSYGGGLQDRMQPPK